jgi:hypothetical protein
MSPKDSYAFVFMSLFFSFYSHCLPLGIVKAWSGLNKCSWFVSFEMEFWYLDFFAQFLDFGLTKWLIKWLKTLGMWVGFDRKTAHLTVGTKMGNLGRAKSWWLAVHLPPGETLLSVMHAHHRDTQVVQDEPGRTWGFTRVPQTGSRSTFHWTIDEHIPYDEYMGY